MPDPLIGAPGKTLPRAIGLMGLVAQLQHEQTLICIPAVQPRPLPVEPRRYGRTLLCLCITIIQFMFVSDIYKFRFTYRPHFFRARVLRSRLLSQVYPKAWSMVMINYGFGRSLQHFLSRCTLGPTSYSILLTLQPGNILIFFS